MKLVEIKEVRVGQIWQDEEVICYIVNDYRPFGISCVWKQMLKNSGCEHLSTESEGK